LFVDVIPYLNNPQKMKWTLEETVEGRRRYYVVSFIDVSAAEAQLAEKLWIDRTNFDVTRKEMFGKDGKVDMDVKYSDYQAQGDIPFPNAILIERPADDYTLKISFQKATMNEKLAADAFKLDQPDGAELVKADGSSGTN